VDLAADEELGTASGDFRSGTLRLTCDGSTLTPTRNGSTFYTPTSITDPTPYSTYRRAGIGTYIQTNTGTNTLNIASFLAADLVTETWTQEGYRWRADDGSETTATWLETQDTPITRALSTPTRLRLLLDTAAADPATTQVRLDYKEDSEAASLWRPVGQGLPGNVPTVSLLGSNSSGTADAASLAISVTPATIQVGDLLIMLVSVDGIITGYTGPADWSTIPGITNGPPGTDDTPYAAAHYKIAVSGDTSASSYSVSWTTSQERAGVILRVPAGQFDAAAPFSIAANGGISGTTATAVPLAPSVTTTRSNCLIIRAFAADDDDAASENDGSLSLSGGALFDLQPATNGPTLFGGYHSQAAAGASGTFTFALALAEEWYSWTIAVQPALGTPAIALSASGNIAASGEVTTAQLAAPAGKTTGDFGGGRIQDDENPADTVDLALNDYGEWEWCLLAQSPAVNGEVYQFRATRNGTALDTYAVTPQWTIGTAGGGRASKNIRSHPLGIALGMRLGLGG
jgi:hypothetical protein